MTNARTLVAATPHRIAARGANTMPGSRPLPGSYASVAKPIGEAGRPLPPGARGPLEGRFGRSLADIRIHDSDSAQQVARRHHANAVTVGSDIYFGRGRLRAADSVSGALLAHEVAHALQARAGQSGTRADAEAEAAEIAARAGRDNLPLPVPRWRPPAGQPLFDAASLRTAIDDELDDVFVGIDNVWELIRKEPPAERDPVRTDKVLERNMRRNVGPMDLLKTYLLLNFQEEANFPAQYRGFIEATDMLGTHEQRIFSILRGVSQPEREEMQQMPGFVEVIEDEMSGDELQLGLQLLYGQVDATGTGVASARPSTHLEVSERYSLDVGAGGSFDEVDQRLSAATEETAADILLADTSLWARIADEFNDEETWYLRMVARYGGAEKFPKMTGPKAPAESFIFPIWNAVKGGGTDEELLLATLTAAGSATGMSGGRQATPTAELMDDNWFIPMLEDELSGDDLKAALAAVGSKGRRAAGIEEGLEQSIRDRDMAAIRKALTDKKLAADARQRLQGSPVILEAMGARLSGAQLCETSLLLKYGAAPLPADLQSLLTSFQATPVAVDAAVKLLQSLAATAGALSALRDEPGVYFMVTNSDLAYADSQRLLAALRSDDSAYQVAGSEGFYHTSNESVQPELPVHFSGTEVRIPIRCNIDRSRMKAKDDFDRGLIEDWLRAIDSVWNGRFLLDDGTHQLPLVFSPYLEVDLASPGVTIFVMDWAGRSFVRAIHDPARNIWIDREMNLYLKGLDAMVVAHEFGHILGNPDEYALTPPEYARFTGKAPVSPSPAGTTVKGLMGAHYQSTEVAVRHAAPALEVVNAVRDTKKFPKPFALRKVT